MSYLEIIDRILEKQIKEEATPQGDISLLRLSELAKRNMGIKIFSEILGCDIWLCSNEQMALSVRQDNPETVTYTVKEMREILRLRPTPDDIKHIHNAKNVLNGSKIVPTIFTPDSAK